jgi:sterol desaturase/sphingolipid hydroxylase (fatty acid hydroxylase superfamily)
MMRNQLPPDHSPDLFKSAWLNRLTRTHIAFPVSIFFCYAAGLLYYTAIYTELSLQTTIILFLLGLLFFTFAEYTIHRWVYHPSENASEGYRNFTYKVHGVHHDYPRDKQRLAMPPWLSLLVATVLLLIFRFVLGVSGFTFAAGFLVGYALYLLVHYTVHAFPPPRNRFRVLWDNHAIHHHVNEDILFGVSSPLWDYVFGTLPAENSKRNVQVRGGD